MIHYVAVSKDDCKKFDRWKDAHKHYEKHMVKPKSVFECKDKQAVGVNLDYDVWADSGEDIKILYKELNKEGYTEVYL